MERRYKSVVRDDQKFSSKPKDERNDFLFLLYKKCSEVGIRQFSKIESSFPIKNSFANMYLVESLRDCWERVNLCFDWLNSSYEQYSYYPARTAYEKILKLDYFIGKLNSQQREALAITELKKVNTSIYNYTGDESFKERNDEIEQKREFKNPRSYSFPSTADLCEATSLNFGKNPYFWFEATSIHDHANMPAMFMKKHASKFTFNTTLALMVTRELVKFQDNLLNGNLKEFSKLDAALSVETKNFLGETDSSADYLPSKPRDEEGNKIGRNDPCYCGSGKKYKKCHGA